MLISVSATAVTDPPPFGHRTVKPADDAGAVSRVHGMPRSGGSRDPLARVDTSAMLVAFGHQIDKAGTAVGCDQAGVGTRLDWHSPSQVEMRGWEWID
jgi:hypothetical protein